MASFTLDNVTPSQEYDQNITQNKVMMEIISDITSQQNIT